MSVHHIYEEARLFAATRIVEELWADYQYEYYHPNDEGVSVITFKRYSRACLKIELDTEIPPSRYHFEAME